MNKTIRNEFAGEMFGVQGRFFNVIADGVTGRIRNQTFKATRPWGEPSHTITVEIRFDDNCNNGHESFAITGYVINKRRKDGYWEMGGCIHEELQKYFPELQHLIRWHLCSTDGPMHYIANTVYHAGNRDHWGLTKGEESKNPRLMHHYVTFGGSPIEHEVSKPLKEFIDSTLAEDGEFIIDRVPHTKDEKTYGSKYQFAGMACKWHECPFDSFAEAEQWQEALTRCTLHWTSRTNHFGEGKERDLDAARRSAIWPEATEDELCSNELEALLVSRLPALLEAFKLDMIEAGFIYPETH